MSTRRRAALALAALALVASRTSFAQGAVPGPDPAAQAPEPEPELRRHEWVVQFRASAQIPEAASDAEVAALKAGGAVLERLRVDANQAWTEHRMLVRTRTPEALDAVLAAVRATPGVVAAASAKLPDIETNIGSPSFMSVYTAPDLQESDRSGVVVKREIPEILDKRDLLEVVDVPWGPEAGPTTPGGLTLNVSELFKRMKESAWRRREQRMKQAELPILPEPDEAASSGDDGQR